MYSSESGVDTDQETRSQECKLVAVIPNKAQYNLKQKIALIFNKDLSDKGSYHAEFKGYKRSKMDVKANKINNCTLIVEAPIYHPVEDVKINVRHRTYEGSKIIGVMPFKFLSREEILADILRDYTGDPVTFMCESLGISPSDISALDDALAVTFKRNVPRGFNLLGLHNDSMGREPCDSLHPTLLHFAAAFGLIRLTKDCLLLCPGVTEASKMRNSRGMKPNEIALNGGYEDLADEILKYQAQQEEGIYESMEKEDPNDAEYLAMAPGYINVQLWQQPSFEMGHGDKEGTFYEDTASKKESGDDIDHGYIEAVRPDFEPDDDDQLYMDMTKPTDNKGYEDSYIDVVNREEQEEELYENFSQDVEESHHGEDDQELYEEMVGDTGMGSDRTEGYLSEIGQDPANPTYDRPTSNLPVSVYPDVRSASVSYGTGGRRPPKPLPKDLPREPGCPPAVPRRTSSEANPIRERLPSTSSKISNLSNASTASGASTSTTGSGHDGDIEEEHDEQKFMSRKELMKQLEISHKEEMQKKERPQAASKTNRSRGPENTYSDAPPPVPPTDYGTQISPPQVPTRVPRSPRGNRNHHERSKTTPVNRSDVQSAQMSNRLSKSIKETSSGTRQPPSGTRPLLTHQSRSDLTYNKAPASFQEQRRNSSEQDTCVGGRPPAPFPVGDRPPAPVPKEPAMKESWRSGVPTPMVIAMEGREEPPPTPRRGASAQQGPPKLLPRPAPRKR